MRGGASSEGRACWRLTGRRAERSFRGGVCGREGAEPARVWKKYPGVPYYGSRSCPLGWPGMLRLATTSQAPGHEVAPWDRPQSGSGGPGMVVLSSPSLRGSVPSPTLQRGLPLLTTLLVTTLPAPCPAFCFSLLFTSIYYLFSPPPPPQPSRPSTLP